jgi:8-oxo-dGTP pyrophosphatase MutT (NUDIX family)
MARRSRSGRGRGRAGRPAAANDGASPTADGAGSREPGSVAASGPSRPRPRADGDARPRRRPLTRVDETSAGGLVVDLDGDVPRGALIGRTDRRGRLLWSLPKGHVEPGETREQAAVREVEEETGISGVIVAELGTIDFWFVADGRRVHKTVHHFLLRATGGELSDEDVEVTEVAWVPLPAISAKLAYPDERTLVDTAGRLLADTA